MEDKRDVRDREIDEKLIHTIHLLNRAKEELESTEIRMITDKGWCDAMNAHGNLMVAMKMIFRTLDDRGVDLVEDSE